MERIGVREVRRIVSVYPRRVEQGEAFTVTDHGRPVAVLAPLPPGDDPLAYLVAAGLVGPPTGSLAHLRPGPPLTGGPTISEVLQQLRDGDPR